MENKIRLSKFLSLAGISSRRKAEELIRAGKIKVNGQVMKTIPFFVDPNKDIVKYNDKKISIKKQKVYLLFHKPLNVLSSHKSQGGVKTIFDFLDNEIKKEKLIIVGRLDKNSRGLIFLTNDGDLANKLMHPKYQIEKEYIVRVKGFIKENFLKKMKEGIRIAGEVYRVKKIKLINKSTVDVVLTEGKKREIRLMIKALKYEVKDLLRIRIANLNLNNLASGEYRFLTEKEINNLYKYVQEN